MKGELEEVRGTSLMGIFAPATGVDLVSDHWRVAETPTCSGIAIPAARCARYTWPPSLHQAPGASIDAEDRQPPDQYAEDDP